jgi:hypothetical protein
MNARPFVIGFSVLVAVAALAAALEQGHTLSHLRAQQRELLAAQAAPDSPAAAEAVHAGEAATAPMPPELLRLRAEVTKLTALQRGLAPVQAENERLRLQLAAAQTNGAAGRGLPPGYVRRKEARMVGYNTPEDTLQTMLWALERGDMTNFLQVLTPEAAQQLQKLVQDSGMAAREFQQEMRAFVGAAVVEKKQLPNGQLELQLLIAPGLPPKPMRLRQIDGQWKLTMD